jgi:hypothetical protein
MYTQMTRHLRTLAAALATSLLLANGAFAAPITNTSTGSIGGVAGSVTQGTITLNVNTLAIVKKAYDLNNAEIADGGNVAKGQTIWILIYLHNSSTAQVNDLRMTDNLTSTGLTLVSGSLQYLNAAATSAPNFGTGSGSMFATSPWVSGGSLPAQLSVTGTSPAETIQLGGASNQYNIPAQSVTALRFQVVVQ